MSNINRPLLLSPAGKDYIWGGRRLKDDFGKDIDLTPLAETWECSTHPDGISKVAGTSVSDATGCLIGENEQPFDKPLFLTDLIRRHPELLGTHPQVTEDGGLPILVKFIDAADRLSVQVHPSDEYAKAHENGSLGKIEMWYVIDADPGVQLVYGFSEDMGDGKLEKALAAGTIEKYLQYVPVQPGDVFFIEPGTVHAIGAGILLAEIQESSNLTYRLYDYGRPGKDGKPRELHVEKALQVVNRKASTEPRQPLRVLRYQPGYASEFLCRCRYFQVERVLLNTERIRPMAPYRTGSTSFEVLLCIDGCGTFFWEDEHLPFFKGDCIFVPADSVNMHIHGQAELLRIRC